MSEKFNEYRKSRRHKAKQSRDNNTQVSAERMRRFTMEPGDITVFKTVSDMKKWEVQHNVQ